MCSLNEEMAIKGAEVESEQWYKIALTSKTTERRNELKNVARIQQGPGNVKCGDRSIPTHLDTGMHDADLDALESYLDIADDPRAFRGRRVTFRQGKILGPPLTNAHNRLGTRWLM